MNDIPPAPVYMRAYARIRGFLTPKHSVYYIVLESAFVGVASSSLIYFILDLEIITLATVLLSIASVGVLSFVTTRPDRRKYSTTGINNRLIVYLAIVIASVSLTIGYPIISEQDPTREHYVASLITGTYLLTIIVRSRKYLGDRDFFTDEDSQVADLWERGSVSLETALKKEGKNNLSMYYWSKRAESTYEDIVEDADRVVYRESATALSAAAGLIAASTFTNRRKSNSLRHAAKQSIKEASELLSVRVCDNCGRKRPVDDCRSVQKENGGRAIFCSQCINSRRSDSSRKSDNNRRKSEESDQNSKSSKNHRERSKKQDRSNTRDRTDTTKKSKQRETSDRSQQDRRTGSTFTRTEMTKSEALDSLDLNKVPKDESKIHKAFRSRVKETHPDVGGSEEEFKKVKKARDVLLNR